MNSILFNIRYIFNELSLNGDVIESQCLAKEERECHIEHEVVHDIEFDKVCQDDYSHGHGHHGKVNSGCEVLFLLKHPQISGPPLHRRGEEGGKEGTEATL